jgi:hypothetical protein
MVSVMAIVNVRPMARFTIKVRVWIRTRARVWVMSSFRGITWVRVSVRVRLRPMVTFRVGFS